MVNFGGGLDKVMAQHNITNACRSD